MPDDPLLDIQDLRIAFPCKDGPGGRRRHLDHPAAARCWAGGRERLRQDRDGPVHSATSCRAQPHRSRPDPVPRGDRAATNGRPGTACRPTAARSAQSAARTSRMIFQEPMSSFSPVHTIGNQIVEAILLHQHVTRTQAPRARRIELLTDGGHPRRRAAARPLPAPVLGRHAPARHDRHGPVVPTVAADRRRADHGAGCDHPGPDPRPDARRCRQRVRHGGHVHHPQPGRHRADRRQRGHHVHGQGGGVRAGARHPVETPSTPTPSTCCRRCRGWARPPAATWWPIGGSVPSPFERPDGLPASTRAASRSWPGACDAPSAPTLAAVGAHPCCA